MLAKACLPRQGERHDREFGGLDVIVQKFPIISPDRRHKDQHLPQHDVKDGEQEQPPGKAVGSQLPALGQTGADAAKRVLLEHQDDENPRYGRVLIVRP